MEHRPFISVIIPVWNGARYLDACLNSILRQSWQHFEIIIVDDGSRDATWNMLMHWKGIMRSPDALEETGRAHYSFPSGERRRVRSPQYRHAPRVR